MQQPRQQQQQRTAPVPALEGQRMTGADGDFVALNKQLRACYVCRLIKTGPQVRAGGVSRAEGTFAELASPLLPCGSMLLVVSHGIGT